MAMIEKAMYIKGACDFADIDKTTGEGKLIGALVDVIMDMAKEIDALEAKVAELGDYCEELDSDLGDVEEVLLDLDDDEDDDDFDFDDFDEFDGCDGNCAACDLDCDFGDEDDDDDWDEDVLQIICPSCGDEINFSGTIDPENLCCPGCGEKIGCIVSEDDYKAINGDDEDTADAADAADTDEN